MKIGIVKQLRSGVFPPLGGSGWVIDDGDKQYKIYPPYDGTDFYEAIRTCIDKDGKGDIKAEYTPYNYTDEYVTIVRCLTKQDLRDLRLEELLK